MKQTLATTKQLTIDKTTLVVLIPLAYLLEISFIIFTDNILVNEGLIPPPPHDIVI